MRSSAEHTDTSAATPETGLLQKIEELSFLRVLNDNLVRARNYPAACQTLVDLVWEEGWADAVAYISADTQRRVCRLEARAPREPEASRPRDLSLHDPLFTTVLEHDGPVVTLDQPVPTWMLPADAEAADDTILLGAPMRVRDATKGILLVLARGDHSELEEHSRILAIAVTSAALALDSARADAREEFLAALRHDINNPITAALGCAEVLTQELENGEPLHEFATAILGSLESVTDLVSNYLHLSAIDQGTPWLHLEKVDLGALTASVVKRFRAAAKQKAMTLVFHDSGAEILADARQLERVITNLVSNAIKYTPKEGHVEVVASTDDSGAVLSVRDTGVGLTPEQIAGLFEKYTRYHRDTEIPGTGLGLFISKALTEAHGGRIEVESEPGVGTTFTVHLPA